MSDTQETVDATKPSRLGWRAERRPPPGFAHVLGAAAGAWVVVAIVAFIVASTDQDPTAPGVVFSAGLTIVALAAGFVVPGPIRAACVTAIVLSVPLIWIFAVLADGPTRGNLRLVYILTALSYLVVYLMGWTKGRAILLAGALLFLATWITFEVATDSAGFIPIQGQIDNSQLSGNLPNTSLNGQASDTSTTTAVVTGVIGLVYLAVGAALDRRKLRGAATPFIAIGAFEAIIGAIALGTNESVLLAAFLTICGRRRRRAGRRPGRPAARRPRGSACSPCSPGFVAIIVDIAPDSEWSIGGIALGFALVLGCIAWFLAPVLGEPDDGNDTPVPPPTPRPASDADTAESGDTPRSTPDSCRPNRSRRRSARRRNGRRRMASPRTEIWNTGS